MPLQQPETVPGCTRRTVAAASRIDGIGLFTGAPVHVTISPALQPNGIVFRRTDLPGAPTVSAMVGNVASEQRRTVLQASPAGGGVAARVETVEHLLAALAGLGISDALIDVDGPEIPIGDGSALPFTTSLCSAGTAPLDGFPVPAPIRVTTPLTVGEKGAQVDAFPLPANAPPGLELIYGLDYGPSSPIPAQEAAYFCPIDGNASSFRSQVAPARTFSTAEEAQAMRRMGLFTQFQPRDLLVIGPDGPIDNSLRFTDEPARHKVLDMLGDLSLTGRPIIGRIVATRSGHALNHQMARALASLP